MNRVVYRPDAVADIEEAVAWYERQRAGLGNEFSDALRDAEEAMQASPLAYRLLHRDTRRYLLRRFPYQLLYRILGDAIVIVACFHVRRSPRRIKGRV